MAGRPGSLRNDLTEREKELDALYRFAALFSRVDANAGAAIETTETILRASMRFPDAARVTVSAPDAGLARSAPRGDRAKPDPGVPSSQVVDAYRSRKTYGDGKRVVVTVRYVAQSPARSALVIEPRERRLIGATASLLANLLQRCDVDRELRSSSETLRRQAEELERKNVALEEVLARIETDKRSLAAAQRAYLDTYVLPYLFEIASASGDRPFVCDRVVQIEAGLSHLPAPNADRLARFAGILSPRESEVCGLVRSGMSTKEIASFLGLATSTVERHRNTIRRKLGLSGTRINLTAFLRGPHADSDHAGNV